MHKIITITGPSGSGKTTLEKKFFSPDHRLVSFTTREPRPGEVDGIDYYFLSESNILEMEKNDELIEHIIYNGNHYGYTREEIVEKLENGNVVAVLTLGGVEDFLASEFKDLLAPIFLDITLEKVKSNLFKRDDSEENIKKRISLYLEESKNKEYFKQLEGAQILKISENDDIYDVEQAFFHLLCLIS